MSFSLRLERFLDLVKVQARRRRRLACTVTKDKNLWILDKRDRVLLDEREGRKRVKKG